MMRPAHIAYAAASPAASGQGALVQRKCACGGAPGPTGACAECRRKKKPGLQAKLRVSRPGDRYEREADQIADRVLRSETAPAPLPVTPLVQREGDTGGAGGDGAMTAPPAVEAALSAPGRALDGGVRAFMEDRFGHDFSAVRVHTDGRAAASAASVEAQAFAVGRDVVFGAGAYRPETANGRRLIAHELVHTIQQRTARPSVMRRPRRQPGGGTGSALLHDCSTWRSASNLSTILSTAVTLANQAVQGLAAVVSNWGALPASPLVQATVMGLRRGFNMEADKSAWAAIGINPTEIATIDRRDRAAAQTILANFRLIAADAPNYRTAPACTRTLTPGRPCLGCVDAAHTRCRGQAAAAAFVFPQMIGTPSSPVFFCPGFFGLSSDEAKAEAFLHEVAHLQTFAPSDRLGNSRYYGCPVAPIDRGGPGLTNPNDFIRIADSYRCLLETLRVHKGLYEERARAQQESERAVQGITAPAPAGNTTQQP